MRLDAEAIRSALRCERAGCSCWRSKQVHCPAHDDKHPSLSVDTGDDGLVLVHCFAGCAQEAVLGELRARGLWSGHPPAPPRPKGLLEEVCRFIDRYLILPSGHSVIAIALWVLHTWVVEAFEVTPYLIVKSAEKRSGKTQLLEVLGLLTARAWHVIQPTEAVLFRKIHQDHPVLLLDEGDTIFNTRSEKYEPLRAVLNAGFRRGTTVPRCVGEGAKLRLMDFEVFCPKAIAAIGHLPDTIEDRGIVIQLERATPAEQRQIRRLRLRRARTEAAPLRDELGRWAEAALPKLREARPVMPDELDGRAQDAWEPLFAVADQAGDGWYVVTWQAALALSGGQARRDDDSFGVRLLADTRRAFHAQPADRVPTTRLIDALCEDETAPWGDWRGHRITPHVLSRLLRPFGVRPVVFRVGEATLRGYRREDFDDAWRRYLPALSSAEGLNSQQPQQSATDAGSGAISDLQQDFRVAVVNSAGNTHRDCIVADVAVQTPIAADADLFAAPEDLEKGDGLGQAILRVGEERAWADTPYVQGRAIAGGKRAWLTFVRVNPVNQLRQAFEGLNRGEALTRKRRSADTSGSAALRTKSKLRRSS